MLGGSAGSIYAEAKLDISQFESAANALGSSTQKIAQDFEKAGASASKLEAAGLSILSIQEQAELAARSAGNLEEALRAAIAAGDDPSAILKLNAQYEKAAINADRLGEAAYGVGSATDAGAISMAMYGDAAETTSAQFSTLAGSMGSFESFANSVLSSASRSIGTLLTKSVGISSSSLGGILMSRTAGVGLRTLVKSLGSLKLGFLGVGAAAVVAGAKIGKALNDAQSFTGKLENAFENFDDADKVATINLTAKANITTDEASISAGLKTTLAEVTKIFTNGKIDDDPQALEQAKSAIDHYVTSMYAQIAAWEKAKIQELKDKGIFGQAFTDAASEVHQQALGMYGEVGNITEGLNGIVEAAAGASTADAQAALDKAEQFITRAEELDQRARELLSQMDLTGLYNRAAVQTGKVKSPELAENALEYTATERANAIQAATDKFGQVVIEAANTFGEDSQQYADAVNAAYDVMVSEWEAAQKASDTNMAKIIAGILRIDADVGKNIQQGAKTLSDGLTSSAGSGISVDDFLSSIGLTETDVSNIADVAGTNYDYLMERIGRALETGAPSLINSVLSQLGEVQGMSLSDIMSSVIGTEFSNTVPIIQSAIDKGFIELEDGMTASDYVSEIIRQYFHDLELPDMSDQEPTPVGVPVEMQPEIVGGTDPYDTMTSEEKEAINRMPEPEPIEVEQTIETQPIVEDKPLQKSEYPSAEELFGKDVYSSWFGDQEPAKVEVPVGMVPIVESLGGETQGEYPSAEEFFGADVYSAWFGEQESIPIEVPVEPELKVSDVESADGPLVALVKQLETSEPQTIQIPVDVDVSDEMYASGNDGGTQFGAGIVTGIQSKAGAVMAAARAIASAAAATIRDALKINSPSKVTTKYGEYFDLGFIRGIENEIPHIDSAIRDALDITPHSVLYRGSTFAGAAATSGGGMQIDYDRLAAAMNKRPVTYEVDGVAFAKAQSNNAARQYNSHQKRINFGYGK